MRYLISFAFFFVAIVLGILIFDTLMIIHVNTTKLISFLMVLFGLATAYFNFGREKKVLLFLGTSLFFIGITFYLTEVAPMISLLRIAIPSTVLIAGISSLVVFFDDESDKKALKYGLGLTVAGLLIIAFMGEFRTRFIIKSIVVVVQSYTGIFAMALIAVLFVAFRSKFLSSSKTKQESKITETAEKEGNKQNSDKKESDSSEIKEIKEDNEPTEKD